MAALDFFACMKDQFTARIEGVTLLTASALELIVRAPAAARNFRPGQFFRFQNFVHGGRSPLLKPMPLSGCAVDPVAGTVSLIVLQVGSFSRACQNLCIGETVSLMGPTGAPSYIPQNQNVLLIGGGLGNAVLLPVAKAMKENGCSVTYIGAYKKNSDLFKKEEIEEATYRVIWCCEEGDISLSRTKDALYKGNAAGALLAMAKGQLFPESFLLPCIDHVLLIGSVPMMKTIATLLKGDLCPFLKPTVTIVAGINSRMQCMMKGVCGQCLQQLVDPLTGNETVIFSCAEQEQPLEHIDFQCMGGRLETGPAPLGVF